MLNDAVGKLTASTPNALEETIETTIFTIKKEEPEYPESLISHDTDNQLKIECNVQIKTAEDTCRNNLITGIDSVEEEEEEENTYIMSIREHVCGYCGKAFGQASGLGRHIESIHEGIRYTCEICGKIFNGKKNLQVHIESVHEGKRYLCEICGQSFNREATLKIHDKTIHKGIRNHQCAECGRYFSRRRSLKRHIDKIHRVDQAPKRMKMESSFN